MWTNLLCISHNHILVHLSCHSITKTKQGPFRVTVRWTRARLPPKPQHQRPPSPARHFSTSPSPWSCPQSNPCGRCSIAVVAKLVRAILLSPELRKLPREPCLDVTRLQHRHFAKVRAGMAMHVPLVPVGDRRSPRPCRPTCSAPPSSSFLRTAGCNTLGVTL
jgi:hypothetical protein